LVPRWPGTLAGAVFIGYMSFQYMTTPSLFSLIMSHVSKEEQSGASALNFVVTCLAGVVGAFAAGSIIEQHGYAQLLTGCAALAMFTAMLTRTLLPSRTRAAKLAKAAAVS